MARKAALVAVFVMFLCAPPAQAQNDCSRVVVFTLPGVTWEHVAEIKPPQILELAQSGAVASISVRTNTPRTSYASGFASLGAGARVDGGHSSGGLAESFGGRRTPVESVRAGGLDEMRRLLDDAGYSTVVPGALGSAVDPIPGAAIGNSDPGFDPPVPLGPARWSLLAAMDSTGYVDLSATRRELLKRADAPFGVATDEASLLAALDEVLRLPCSVIVVDPGDLTRRDEHAGLVGSKTVDLTAPLLAADDAIGHVREQLDPADLLLVVSPTSPAWDDDVHFGVAIAAGVQFPAGAYLESPSTRRPGIVTLPDVAPTVLAHLGIDRPGSMLGRVMFARATSEDDRLEAALELDAESVFVDRMRTPVSTAFVIVQVLVYLLVLLLLTARRRRPERKPGRHLDKLLSLGALAVVAFPLCTYLAGVVDQHSLGPGGFVALLLGLDALVVACAALATRAAFDRLLFVVAVTSAVLLFDLVTGARLQVNTVFSYSPLVAGRFAGIGNIAYAVLAAAVLLTATLVVHRERGSARALTFAGVLFAAAVLVDGGPAFGGDVGGVLALIPGLGITWMLLAGRRPNLKTSLLLVVAVLVALGLFLAFDLSQPEVSRTHLARLYEDVRDRGGQVFADVIQRKVQTNVRVFRSTIWTYLVPPAVAAIAWLLLRPRNRWQLVAETYPRLRAGLIGALVLAVLGYAVNDSGIVVPAMMLSFIAPMALLMHMSLEHEQP